ERAHDASDRERPRRYHLCPHEAPHHTSTLIRDDHRHTLDIECSRSHRAAVVARIAGDQLTITAVEHVQVICITHEYDVSSRIDCVDVVAMPLPERAAVASRRDQGRLFAGASCTSYERARCSDRDRCARPAAVAAQPGPRTRTKIEAGDTARVIVLA